MTVAEFINKVGFKVDESSVNQVQGTINDIKSTAAKLLGAIGIGFSLSQLNAIADEFNQINDRINYAVGFADDMKETQKDILAAANDCKVSYNDMASAVVKLKTANEEVFPINEAAEFVEYINKLGKSAGYSDGEISTMQSMIQRVVASGTMGTSEITRILRQTPALIDTICKGLEVTQDELMSMADAGKITTDTLKQAVFNAEDDIDNSFSKLNYSIGDALLNIRNQWGFWVDDINSSLLISETLAKTLVKGFTRIMTFLNKGRDAVMELSEKLGGTENMLKLIAVAAAAIFLAFNFTRIISGVTAVGKAIKAAFSLKNLGIAALIAIITILFLIVEDFVAFMKGNDSVIGYAFQKAGIDAEEMRNKIVNIWNNLKAFFGGIWNSIRAVFTPVIDFIKKKMEDTFGDDFFTGVGTGFAGFIDTIEKLTSKLAEDKDLQNMIGKVAVAVAGLAAAFSIIKKFSGIAGTLKDIATGGTSAAKGLGGTSSSLGNIGKNIATVGGGILMVAAGLFLLAEAAVRVSSAGAPAIALLAGMVVAIAALIAVAGLMGSRLSEGASGMLILGAGLLMCAAAMAVMSASAIALSQAGAPTIAMFAAFIVVLAALIAAVVLLGPELLIGAAGLAVFGLALDAIAVAAAIGAAALAIVAAVLPQLVEYGASGAVAILELSGALAVFGAGAAVAGVGVGAAAVAFAALAVAALAASVPMAALAVEMGIIGAAIAVMAVSGTTAAAGLSTIKDSASGMLAKMTGLAAALTIGAAGMAPFAVAMAAGAVAVAGLDVAVAAASLVFIALAAAVALTDAALIVAGASILVFVAGAALVIGTASAVTVAFALIASGSVLLAASMAVLAIPITIVAADMLVMSASSLVTAASLVVMAAAIAALDVLLVPFPALLALSIASLALTAVAVTGVGLASLVASPSILVLTAGLTAFSASATVAGAASLVALAGFTALAAGTVLAAVMFSGFADEMVSVGGAVSTMASSSQAAAQGLKEIKDVGGNAFKSLLSIIVKSMSQMQSSVQSGGSEITSALSNAMKGMNSLMASMPATAYTWGSDMVKGISKGMNAASGTVKASAVGIAGIISSYLHFSTPDEGPLASYESWMPDFVKGLAKGINDNKDSITEAISNVSGKMSALANANVVSPATSSSVMSSTTNNRSVSQNVNINNNFNGDRAIQKEASQAMDNSAKDITAELARGLAYSR